MRFWDTDSGTISIGKRDIRTVNTNDLRNMESYMTQDTHLFCDSIRNNIRIARLDATDEDIENACKKASIHNFIMTLSKGYDTPVGELGDTLSGGEKQRVAIARAIAKNPKLLLCDEPTGALDYKTGKQILKLLQDTCRREKMTVVIITHNTAIAPMADKVIHFKNGTAEKIVINEKPISIDKIEW